MKWHLVSKRDLPWRSEPNPYSIWISEVMLQQTQVVTVLPYYSKFLDHYPDLETLAHASEQDVLSLWSGLGYYSRARNLHKAARKILQSNGGIFPSNFESILALPGIGRYTAGAICSLAYNQPQPIVDGNIRRVIIRLNGIRTHAPESYFWKQMKFWIPDGKASTFNQAMMELGALICTPFQPRCGECPIKGDCKALKMNLQNRLPHPRQKRPASDIKMIILILHNRNKLILINKTADFIPGRWGFPYQFIPDRSSARENARDLSLRILGVPSRLSSYCSINHTIVNRRITAYVFACEGDAIRPDIVKARWIERSKAGEMLTSSLFTKALSKTKY
jgi:A/G-specific adenine glycosylase